MLSPSDLEQLTVHDVSHHFGRRRALSHVSLTCKPGEIVGLLGPNGAGKSTLLAVVASLIRPSSGEVRYGTSTVQPDAAALRGRIGLLGHELHLYAELTARENLEFFARLYGLADTARRVSGALERAGLTSRGHELVSSFSRGMRQRLALERALLHEPRLVLLDEPFTGLDDLAARALVERLRELRRVGCIVMVATHDLETAQEVVTRAVVLREGRLEPLEEGARSLRDRYREKGAAPLL